MKPKLILAVPLRGFEASKPHRQVIFLAKPQNFSIKSIYKKLENNLSVEGWWWLLSGNCMACRTWGAACINSIHLIYLQNLRCPANKKLWIRDLKLHFGGFVIWLEQFFKKWPQTHNLVLSWDCTKGITPWIKVYTTCFFDSKIEGKTLKFIFSFTLLWLSGH